MEVCGFVDAAIVVVAAMGLDRGGVLAGAKSKVVLLALSFSSGLNDSPK
jgi:hypothetical protein